MTNMPNLLIIVPAYNEEGNVGRTVLEIKDRCPEATVLVIDDGSADQTAVTASQAGAEVISLPFNLGIGGAVQTGFQYARRRNFTWAVQVDGDGQHDPGFIPAVLKPLKDKKADIIVGSRFIEPFLGYRSSLTRRMGIHFFSFLISGLTGCRITDPTSGFRAFNAKAIILFSENYPQDFPEPESIVLARQAGLNVLEVPVKMRKRVFGLSSIRYLRTLYYMVKVTSAIFLDILKKKV